MYCDENYETCESTEAYDDYAYQNFDPYADSWMGISCRSNVFDCISEYIGSKEGF